MATLLLKKIEAEKEEAEKEDVPGSMTQWEQGQCPSGKLCHLKKIDNDNGSACMQQQPKSTLEQSCHLPNADIAAHLTFKYTVETRFYVFFRQRGKIRKIGSYVKSNLAN